MSRDYDAELVLMDRTIAVARLEFQRARDALNRAQDRLAALLRDRRNLARQREAAIASTPDEDRPSADPALPEEDRENG